MVTRLPLLPISHTLAARFSSPCKWNPTTSCRRFPCQMPTPARLTSVCGFRTCVFSANTSTSVSRSLLIVSSQLGRPTTRRQVRHRFGWRTRILQLALGRTVSCPLETPNWCSRLAIGIAIASLVLFVFVFSHRYSSQ